MSRRTIPTCRVLLKACMEGEGHPETEELNGKTYCQGYQVSESDDEPCTECKRCHLNIWRVD